MKSHAALLATIMMVVGTVGFMPIGTAAGTSHGGLADHADSHAAEQTNTTENETPPGAKMAGIVGMQRASINGDIEKKEFKIKMNKTENDTEAAGVVSGEVSEVKEQLAELRERKHELQEEHREGNISNAEFRAKMAELHTEKKQLVDRLNESEEEAEGLPEEKLKANGVNVSAIKTLKQNASNMTGQEVSEIARSIAGNNKTTRGPPGDVPGQGPPGANNTSEDGETPENPGNSGEKPAHTGDNTSDEEGAPDAPDNEEDDEKGNNGKPDNPGNSGEKDTGNGKGA